MSEQEEWQLQLTARWNLNFLDGPLRPCSSKLDPTVLNFRRPLPESICRDFLFLDGKFIVKRVWWGKRKRQRIVCLRQIDVNNEIYRFNFWRSETSYPFFHGLSLRKCAFARTENATSYLRWVWGSERVLVCMDFHFSYCRLRIILRVNIWLNIHILRRNLIKACHCFIFLLVDVFPSSSGVQASCRWLHSKADQGSVIISVQTP